VQEYQGEKLGSINDFRENSILGPQQVDLAAYQLQITGLVNQPQTYSYRQVLDGNAHYQKVTTLHCVEGWSVKILWNGVLLSDLLASAGVKPEAKIAIFKAVDGYTTSLPLDYLVQNKILVAYEMNGVTLPPERGFPFQLVAENKWGYKWIKWLKEIELSDNVEYKGYWESRGYGNSGDYDEGGNFQN
jgi:DMSO/TMAO reductase YedYZ molybdopterin-dependent catalytic subunit